MTKPRIFFGLCGVFVAVTAGVALMSRSQAGKLRYEQVSVSERIARLNVRLQRAEEQATQVGVVSASSSATRPRSEFFSKPGVPVGAVSDHLQQGHQEGLETELDIQNRTMAWKRAELLVSYSPFFRAMNLSPAQIERLLGAWTQDAMNSLDLAAVVKESGLAARDPAVVAERTRAAAEKRAAEEAELGADGREKLELYRRMAPLRNVVLGFAGKTVLAGMPVSAEQIEQLTEIFAESVPGFRRGGSGGRNSIFFEQVNWASVSAAARTVLSPAQHELLMLEGEKSRSSKAIGEALSVAERAQSILSGKPDVGR